MQMTLTYGMEIELFLCIKDESDNTVPLTDRTKRDAVIERVKQLLPGYLVDPEFKVNQIEIGTPIASSLKELENFLKPIYPAVSKACDELGILTLNTSMWPLPYRPLDIPHSPSARYGYLTSLVGGQIERFVVCGIHLHVGIAGISDDTKIKALHAANEAMPFALGLTTNSAVHNGTVNPMMSNRTLLINKILPKKRCGFLPRDIHTIADLDAYAAKWHEPIPDEIAPMLDEDVIKTMYWPETRLNRRHGTIEARSLEVVSDLAERIPALAALLALAAVYGIQCQRKPALSMERLLHNWQQVQYRGTNAKIIYVNNHESAGFKSALRQFIQKRHSALEYIPETEEYLDKLLKLADIPTDAQAQEKVFVDALLAGDEEPEALAKVMAFIQQRFNDQVETYTRD